MSLALYRRYRPDTFAELIGQEHVTGPLQQALRNNKVNHAYLFSGPRGCGKTTSARILARALNCEQGPTPTPCGTCASCRELATGGGGSIDVIEIDAASHGGVDDARELRERAFFAPAAARYKIYIIDEAHMVTSAGFNALLKVVEEPPEHLKFIFATTEPEKVIGTIRSRTHHYPFRLVPPGVLRDHLAATCEREGVAVADGVLPLVVRAGAGSVRDSLSVLDQLLAGAGPDGVSHAMATSLLGFTDGTLLDDMLDAFAARDGAAVFGAVDRVIEAGHDPRRFVADLLERFRDLVILAAAPQAAASLIEAAQDQLERMTAQAAALGLAELSRAAELLNAGLTEMRGATAPRLQLELVCARLLLPGADDDEHGLRVRLERLERQAPSGPSAPAQPAPAAPPSRPAPVAPAASVARSAPVPAAPSPAPSAPPPQPSPAPQPSAEAGGSASVVRQRWSEILDATKASRIIWILLNQNARVASVDGDRVSVGFANAGARDSFLNRGGDQVLVAALGRVLGGDWRIDCIVDPSVGGQSGPAGQPPAASAAPPPATTPPPAQPNRPSTQQTQVRPGGVTPSGPSDERPSSGDVPSTPPPAGDPADVGGDWPTARVPGGATAAAPATPPPATPPPAAPSPPVPSPRPTIAPEDDAVADDDPDLDGPGVSSHELLARELGARVIEEVDRG